MEESGRLRRAVERGQAGVKLEFPLIRPSAFALATADRPGTFSPTGGYPLRHGEHIEAILPSAHVQIDIVINAQGIQFGGGLKVVSITVAVHHVDGVLEIHLETAAGA